MGFHISSDQKPCEESELDLGVRLGPGAAQTEGRFAPTCHGESPLAGISDLGLSRLGVQERRGAENTMNDGAWETRIWSPRGQERLCGDPGPKARDLIWGDGVTPKSWSGQTTKEPHSFLDLGDLYAFPGQHGGVPRGE